MKQPADTQPLFARMSRKAVQALRMARFPGSADYWEQRYLHGGTSGAGSYGMWAEYKAGVLNSFVQEHSITSVIEWGCGDGNQLSMAEYPSYIGIDVADAAVQLCASKFGGDDTKSFYAVRTMVDNAGLFRAELALSLEVIFHLVEADVFDRYMRSLFDSADRFVVVYDSDSQQGRLGPHEYRRAFTPWVAENAPEWRLRDRIIRPDRSDVYESDFFVFERSAG